MNNEVARRLLNGQPRAQEVSSDVFVTCRFKFSVKIILDAARK